MCIIRKSIKQEKYPQRNLRTMQINLKLMTTPIQMLKEKLLKGLSCFRLQKTVALSRSNDFQTLKTTLISGKHNYALERETFFDKAILSYATKLDKRDTLLSARRRTI